MSWRKAIIGIIIVTTIGAVGGAGWYYQWRPWGGDSADKADEMTRTAARHHTVQPMDMVLGLTEYGSLRAANHHKIINELESRAKIAWLVKEGSMVAKGEKVLEYENKEFKDKLTEAQNQLEQAGKELAIAVENVKIEESSGKASLNASQMDLQRAREALKKFLDLEAPKKFKDLDAEVNKARTEMAEAEKNLSEVRRKSEGDFFIEEDQRRDLDKQINNARTNVLAKKRTLEGSLLQQKIYRGYEYPQTLAERRRAVSNAELGLAKTEVSVRSQLLQRNNQAEQIRARMRRAQMEIDRFTREIEKSVVLSPADGVLLYGDQTRRDIYFGGSQPIQVGSEVYRGNVVLTIPEAVGFEVDIAVHEQFRGRIKPGLPARITFDAIPGLVIDGELKVIASIAKSRNPWDPTGPKSYESIIIIKSADPRMASGMTAKVELTADTLTQVLAVPIEGVFNHEGTKVCYLRQGTRLVRQPVMAGRSNDHYVEITAGVKAGDMVLLMPPQAGVAVVDGLPLPTEPATKSTASPTTPATVPAAPPAG